MQIACENGQLIFNPISSQNTRGRRVFRPETASQSLGFLVSSDLPALPPFPVYTRSGEVIVDVVLVDDQVHLCDEERELVVDFHKYTFSQVLRLEKFPMVFSPGESENSAFCLPLVKSESAEHANPPPRKLSIDWDFLRRIRDESAVPRVSPLGDADRDGFVFNAEDYSDAVVMPWYRNQDQPQYFYVAEICSHLSPNSDFPGQGFETFANYYRLGFDLQLVDFVNSAVIILIHVMLQGEVQHPYPEPGAAPVRR